MAGGAQQRATPSQGGQSGQMGQGGFGNQVSSLLQNPNLPSMLQNVDTSGISQQNQQAIQQAYQNAQHPVMYATAQPALAPPQMTPQMTPQMMAAAQRMQSQPGQIDMSGQLQPQQFNAAIGMATPTGVVGPGQQGFQMPQGAGQQAASPNMAGLTFDSTPYAGGGSSFSMASGPSGPPVMSMANPMGSGQQGQSQQDPGAALRAQMANYGPGFVSGVGGPDVSGNIPGGNQGFDLSGSDGGVGGQPVSQRQSPMGGRPAMLSDFRQKQGLQVQGNPTAQGVQRGIGALGRRMR